MKKILTIAIALYALAVVSVPAQTDLLSLSDPQSFGSLVSPTFSGLGVQTNTGFVYNGTVDGGDNVYGTFESQNWSSQLVGSAVFSVLMSVSGGNPNIPFSLEFLDNELNSIDIWEGTTVGLGSIASYNDLTINTAGSGNYSNVSSFVLTWNNVSAETLSSTVSTIAVVPEPSTCALLAISGLAFGGYVVRRRRP